MFNVFIKTFQPKKQVKRAFDYLIVEYIAFEFVKPAKNKSTLMQAVSYCVANFDSATYSI